MRKGLKAAQYMREFGRQSEDCQGEYVCLFPLGVTKSCYCSLVFNAILGLLCFKRDLPKRNVGCYRNRIRKGGGFDKGAGSLERRNKKHK